MDTAEALDRVRGKLDSSFGKAMAMMVLASASTSCGVSTFGLTADEFRRLAKAVTEDQRVKDMWGEAGAHDIAADWCSLVS